MSHGESQRDELSYYHFDTEIIARIEFDDGSYAVFHYPLVIEAPEWNEVGVFTEHCGYHLFTLRGIQVKIVPRTGQN